MVDSDFWRDLAEQFRALDPAGLLYADHDYIVNSGNVDQWQIKGADRIIRLRFEALARRAGSKIAGAHQKDPLFIWLGEVKATGPNFEYGAYLIERNADGTDGIQHQLGTLKRLCVASAERCTEHESYALQAELREKQQRIEKQAQIWTLMEQHSAELKQASETATLGPVVDDLHTVASEESSKEKSPEAGTRRSKVEEFLRSCNAHSKIRIRRRHIWLLAGHTKGRQFEFWQADSDKATDADERNFRRILGLAPAAFIAQLQNKGIIPHD